MVASPDPAASLTLRPLAEADLPRLLVWLNVPQVREWFDAGLDTLDRVRTKYLPRIRGETDVVPFVALHGHRPIAYCQTYRLDPSSPAGLGCDILIGEPDCLDRGLGTRIMTALVERAFQDPRVAHLQVDPSSRNARAIRCFAKAGFAPLRTVQTDDGEFDLMQRQRR